MHLSEVGELGLIDQIKKIVEVPAEGLLVGIDDDAAAFRNLPDSLTVISSDTLIEGVHFDLRYFDYHQLGWRAMAANLSDIAAMGAMPRYVVTSIGLPPNLSIDSVNEFYRGVKALAERFHTSVIGGDTVSSPDRIFIAITIIGHVNEAKLTLRSGAQIGDCIFATGSLGSSQAGLKILNSGNSANKEKFTSSVEKHLTPTPRINEARFLVEHFPIHSMIDVSDGLASEINHICKNSEVGAVISANKIFVDDETNDIAHLFGGNALDYALYGGEDFELLFTAPSDCAEKLQNSFQERFDLPCSKIGKITETGDGIHLETLDGHLIPIQSKGYDHFRKI